MLRCWVALLLLGLATLCRAEPLPLARLLEQAADGPAERALEAELAVLNAQRQQREAEAGWQWFASAGTGRYRELVTEDLRDDYYGRDLALGLRHPLLGSLHRQQDALRGLQAEHQQLQARRLGYRAEQRLALRSAYADWWRAQQEQRWCASLEQPAAQARRQLAERLRSGWLLASEARLQDDRWQALQRRCTAIAPLLEETAQRLSLLSGRPLGSQQQAEAEALADSVQPLAAWLQKLEVHPRLEERREQLRAAEQGRKSPWYASVDSSFSVAQSYEARNGGNQPGSGLVASISLSTPFDPLAYGQARDDEGQARHAAALARLEAERDGLARALAQALQAHRLAAEALRQAREELEVADLAMREQRLRRDGDIDQAFLGSLSAELERGQAGLRLIAAWHELWLREASLRLFVDADAGLAALLGRPHEWQALAKPEVQATLAKGRGWRQGTYVWDSRALLEPTSRDQALQALRAAGMQRVYLGLSAAQIGDRRLPERLRQLLDATRAQRLETVLLLGDPQWLLPQARQGLLDLLATLAPLPFAAVHLDLEVEQLGWPVPPARLQDWLDTLEAAARVSPWPLELSSHHRWFAAPQAGEVCVPCRLTQLGVRQVSLMIYTRNAERSAALAEDIARRWPGLGFRLAQSVEPQLAAEESWRDASRAQLQTQAERWRVRLQAYSVSGIDWQDWSHFPH